MTEMTKGYHNSTTELSARDEFRTPPYLFKWARSLLGRIEWDAACTLKNNIYTPIWLGPNFKDRDALSFPWHGFVFCNPPYSQMPKWVDHALSSSGAITAFLCPSPNGESYYNQLIANSHEIAIIGRVAFIGADGKPKPGNNRGSSLFIINGYGQGSRSVVRRDDLIDRFS